MTDPANRSNDKYYKSKDNLLFRQTSEGRVKRRQPFEYHQTVDDVAASADKYYRSPEVHVDSVEAQNADRRSQNIDILDPADTLTSIISAFSNGFNAVTLSVYEKDLSNVRTTLDLAVGRNTLTREQADAVSIESKLEPVVENKTELEASPSATTQGAGLQRKGRKRKVSEAVIEDNVGETAGLVASSDTNPEGEKEELQSERLTEVNADDSDE